MCSKGFVKFQRHKFSISLSDVYSAPYRYLQDYPIGISMAIPSCNDGNLFSSRGGVGSHCDRDSNGCKSQINHFRSCGQSNLLKNKGIYLSDDDTKCSKIARYQYSTDEGDYTHDSVIVGYGTSGIYGWWLIRQSWGS